MINFRTGIPIIITQLLPFFANAQPGDSTAQIKPASPYSFEVADSLLRAKKYERAVWAYINLYPRNPDSVAKLVRRVQPAYWDGDLPSFIQTTFARFAPMDPAIATYDFTGPVLDTVQLKMKARWSEALIKRVAEK